MPGPGGYGVPVPPPGSPTTSGWAIAALIMGFAGFVLPVVGGLVAVVLGIVALVQIRRPGSGRKGTAMAAIGIALGLLSAVGWILLVASDDFQEGFQEGLEEAQRDASSEVLLDVGDCLDMSVADSDNFLLSTDDVIACDQPHTAEYAGFATLTEADGVPYPGEMQVFERGIEECLDIFLDYTGVELATRPELDVFVEYPRPVSWRLFNDRHVGCYVIDADRGVLWETVRG